VRKSDESGGDHCLCSDSCCDAIVLANRNCYRAQCFATARGIAERLELQPEDYVVSFQSRLGRAAWIRPYTDETILDMARKGVKKLAVLCPAFVADCLETLEEIGIRARESFEAHGGEELRLVPSLNSDDAWVDAAVRIAQDSSILGLVS
jgi:ferrochelatase